MWVIYLALSLLIRIAGICPHNLLSQLSALHFQRKEFVPQHFSMKTKRKVLLEFVAHEPCTLTHKYSFHCFGILVIKVIWPPTIHIHSTVSSTNIAFGFTHGLLVACPPSHIVLPFVWVLHLLVVPTLMALKVFISWWTLLLVPCAHSKVSLVVIIDLSHNFPKS
mgnify:CR=1 FL=1